MMKKGKPVGSTQQVFFDTVNYIAIEMASFSLHLAQCPASIHEGTSHAWFGFVYRVFAQISF
ncbi:hypothetical protein JQC72_05255 [Polycladomyces sp. WAk]|uniref:Uncharacterized protein n=1 Tax=Polycladomyces zharkentensis TaxID=2807616 RepID=A0ABS2WHI2_9BACL|nr:hypothetical protein [Polycladomyces sp. WAk]MBN2908931.1 hypothetical protein [Polycladomyces sp. WAk]